MSAPVERIRDSLDSPEITPSTPSVLSRVAIQHLLPKPTVGSAYPIIRSGHRGEVAHDEHCLVRGFPFAEQADDTRPDICTINPLEPRRNKVALVEGWLITIETVQVCDPLLNTTMSAVLEQLPLYSTVVGPLPPLTEFPTHKQQLLPRLRIHISE